MTTRSKDGRRIHPKNKCNKFGCKNGMAAGEKSCELHKNTETEEAPRTKLSCREKRKRQELNRRLCRGQELRATQ